MKLILLKISILKTAIRVLTFWCIFLPAFVSPFYTDVPDYYFYFAGFCMLFLVVQINLIPRYKVSGKIQIEEEIGITIASKNKTIVYRSSDIKRLDIEYKGYQGGTDKFSPIFMPLLNQEGIGTLYIETVQGRKDWIYYLAKRNVKKNLLSMQSLFIQNGVDFRLIIN